MTEQDLSADPGPTTLDHAFQIGYRIAYRLLRAYWRVRRPTTHGALVAIWNNGQVLLVRNSYVPYYSAPGGYVRRGEPAHAAAARELSEEVGVRVQPAQLTLALETTLPWENKQDHVRIFELSLAERPELHIDHREVIAAGWFSPAHACELNVFPPLKAVIARRL